MLLPAITGIEKVERLYKIIFAIRQEDILGVPKLASSSGNNTAAAVQKLLNENHLLETIQAICCDTILCQIQELQKEPTFY